MKIVFYSVVLNQHQAPVADALWELTGHSYCFVELTNLGDNKGSTEDYSQRPYLLRAWESQENRTRAFELAKTADCCVFSGIEALPYEKARLRLGLLSFEMGERWFKKGLKSYFSPRLWKWLLSYYFEGWKRKPLYKLCCSAFCAQDHNKMGSFVDKVYKWGYFTKKESNNNELSIDSLNSSETIKLMWCARFIDWKHPELPLSLAEKLKEQGRLFNLDMYGDGPLRKKIQLKAENLGINDCVKFHGNVANEAIHEAMRSHNFFLMTSDKSEGWGAVANEAMSEGCLLIGADEIGSIPYLIEDGKNGLVFKTNNLQSLFDIITWAIDNPEACSNMRKAGEKTMLDIWNPNNAALSLLSLIENLKNQKETPFVDGPCSKA